MDVTKIYASNADALADGMEVGQFFIQAVIERSLPEGSFHNDEVRVVMPSSFVFTSME